MMIYRMDHAGVVVEDLAAAIAFFIELGLEPVRTFRIRLPFGERTVRHGCRR
jgi:catechol 2,3-dioxygenase-like lactoylglutathione lyase family enzyme